MVETNPIMFKEGDAALIKIRPWLPLSAEEFKFIPNLGRFVIRDNKKTVAVGMIKSVEFYDD